MLYVEDWIENMESKCLLFLFIVTLLAPCWVSPSPVPDGKTQFIGVLLSVEIVLEHTHIDHEYHHVKSLSLPASAICWLKILTLVSLTVWLNFQVSLNFTVKCFKILRTKNPSCGLTNRSIWSYYIHWSHIGTAKWQSIHLVLPWRNIFEKLT